jgi:hypothetical protein
MGQHLNDVKNLVTKGVKSDLFASHFAYHCKKGVKPTNDELHKMMKVKIVCDNFRMNTRSGRYGAAYNMVGLRCFNEELSLLPKNPTEAKLQATSTRGESTEPT